LGNSTYTVQNIVDYVSTFPDLKPVLAVGGFDDQPALAIMQNVMNYMLSQAFPWKWNEINIPYFYSNSYQQDYASLTVTNLAWLQRGTALDVNNQSNPKPRYLVEVGRSLPNLSGAPLNIAPLANPKFIINWLYNDRLYYGTWGGSSTSAGNDPVAGSVYTNPFSPGASQPSNPITQIRDANGNLLVLTTYGAEGTTAPVAPTNSLAGTTCSGGGATTVWTVVDPKGQGFRIAPPVSQTGTQWQFWLVGQQTPPKLTSLQQALDPIPDEYITYFQQGVVAECVRRSPESKTRARYQEEYAIWQKALFEARMAADRERDEAGFVTDEPLIQEYGGTGYVGAAWPYSYPIN
jgi:hypothetical protein